MGNSHTHSSLDLLHCTRLFRFHQLMFEINHSSSCFAAFSYHFKHFRVRLPNEILALVACGLFSFCKPTNRSAPRPNCKCLKDSTRSRNSPKQRHKILKVERTRQGWCDSRRDLVRSRADTKLKLVGPGLSPVSSSVSEKALCAAGVLWFCAGRMREVDAD